MAVGGIVYLCYIDIDLGFGSPAFGVLATYVNSARPLKLAAGTNVIFPSVASETVPLEAPNT